MTIKIDPKYLYAWLNIAHHAITRKLIGCLKQLALESNKNKKKQLAMPKLGDS